MFAGPLHAFSSPRLTKTTTTPGRLHYAPLTVEATKKKSITGSTFFDSFSHNGTEFPGSERRRGYWRQRNFAIHWRIRYVTVCVFAISVIYLIKFHSFSEVHSSRRVTILETVTLILIILFLHICVSSWQRKKLWPIPSTLQWKSCMLLNGPPCGK